MNWALSFGDSEDDLLGILPPAVIFSRDLRILENITGSPESLLARTSLLGGREGPRDSDVDRNLILQML